MAVICGLRERSELDGGSGDLCARSALKKWSVFLLKSVDLPNRSAGCRLQCAKLAELFAHPPRDGIDGMMLYFLSLASASASSDESCNASTTDPPAAEDDEYGLDIGPCNFIESPAVSPEKLLLLALTTVEPIIVRGMLDGWSAVGDEGVSGLLDEWGALKVDASLGSRMSTEGPPTKAGIWPVKSVRQQLVQAAGMAVDHLAFYDRLVFQNVTGTPQLESLLATAPAAFSHLASQPTWETTRLSMAGARGGIAWHYHEAAVNYQLSGTKRWFAFHNDDPELSDDVQYCAPHTPLLA